MSAQTSSAAPDQGGTARVDAWIWSVRLTKTRSAAASACRAGHVRVNGDRAKPAQTVKPGDEVRLFHEGRERIVIVQRVITKRVGAPVAAECLIDKSPPPPTRVEAGATGLRDRGAGRPTKRERRDLDQLRGR
ncbi:RNA-binding S4 domain-containing protein [Streptomyces sp. NPDC101118]|uniref:RNA-binding S4 domain-containing protein n=1 Tax=unclassified Streptomyces TaxID=2593676 RepID=UPI0037D3CD8D